ncbi:unnamed protein product [marine sediment metagenome]|uniref:ArnR1-like winged helix-turn-helix domain-containing protein n=1 Tax=marine sediment metagenome TaxID=412755 RepID=X1HKZ6_9ZZZZ
MKIKNDLLIEILKKLEDYSNWYKAPKFFDALSMQKEGKSLKAHVDYLIQRGCIEERKNQYTMIREWRITPSGREYLKELLTPEAGFRAD